jgi:hypothetical protein
MSDKDIIYIQPTSWNFWWGVYGLAEVPGWEDFRIFRKEGGQFVQLAVSSVSTLPYLLGALEPDSGLPEDEEFARRIREFEKDPRISFQYYYDDAEDEDLLEVSFEAPRSATGLKPSWVEIWHPGDQVGVEVIREAARYFSRQFLGIEGKEIRFKEFMGPEESRNAFKAEYERAMGGTGKYSVVFSDALIQELSEFWKMDKSLVVKRLEKELERG